MASLIPGYEYDIFISYRQKDNKYDGWVTEFVHNLKRELEATFKEDLSIYFDENPHDGLLETHSVDKSLEGKLKCLIFIPIISQTYCDSKSFAWQNEFVAFNKMTKEDQLGRDIRLTTGNVASRILPVKIHDLDQEDKALLENELGGVLRYVEFIFKSAGVNRPLRANEDHPQDNLAKTYYRDQINKVANAVKEIITALKKYNSKDETVAEKVFEVKPAPRKILNKRTVSVPFLILALLVLGYFFIPKLFKAKEQVEKSIAVLPFHYLGSDTAQAAARSLRLGTDQPRVHLALGYYYLYAYRDIEQAFEHLEIAEKGLPNNVEIMVGKADIIVTRGRWEEYIHLLEKAYQLSPNDASILTDLALGYWCTRRYRDNLDACNQAISLAPDRPWPYLYKMFGYWSWKGPNKESRDALKFIGSQHEWYLFSWYFQEVGEGNFQAALQLMSDTTRVWGAHNKMWTIPRTMFSAFIYDYRNEHDLALIGYKKAMEILAKNVADIPNDPRYHSALGIAYAGLGKKEEAINEGLKAVALLPISKDAVYGVTFVFDLAIIYTMLGEFDLALDNLDQILSIPSLISTMWFEWDIRLTSLKTHPRYKKLLTKYAIDK